MDENKFDVTGVDYSRHRPEKRKLDTTAILDGSSLNKHKTAKNSRQGIDLDGFTQNIGNKTRHSIEIHTSKMQSFVHGKGKHGRNLSKRNISN